MAEVERRSGDDHGAKDTARKIIDARKQEIADMTEWLAKNAR